MRWGILLVLAGALGLSGCAEGPIRLYGSNLRTVDWQKVVTGDPNLVYSLMPSLSGISGAFVQTRDGSVGGFVQTQAVQYLPLAGAEGEVALLPLLRDGSSGPTGLLVYRRGPHGPVLAGTIDGRVLDLAANAGMLDVVTAAYAGWEPPCCPSGILVRRYRLEQGALALVSAQLLPRDEMRAPTVEQYYRLLGEGRLDEARRLLTPALQQSPPPEPWLAEPTSGTPLQVQARNEPDGRVLAELSFSDPATQQPRQERVRWRLEWSAGAQHWQLAQRLAEPPSPQP
ncbi:MAG: hypothetical protein K6U89_05940 [Chloroflexi bacterium]|nr:hypothetical protein [Chloroflexota bacterium]